MKNLEVNEQIAQKVIDVVSCGLSAGLGSNTPGEMCVEAAVCYAYGLPHSDDPPCVGKTIRDFKIRLNDDHWSNRQARAKGMIKIAIAQLGSVEIDQKEFYKRIVLRIINTIAADIAAKHIPEKEGIFRTVNNLKEASLLCENLRDTGEGLNINSWFVIDSLFSASHFSLSNNTGLFSRRHVSDAITFATHDEISSYRKDEILIKAADSCLEVLKELNSPGCKYLYLLD